MARHDIPTAGYKEFTDKDELLSCSRAYTDIPMVLKADGLAAGKGVVIPENEADAKGCDRGNDGPEGLRFGWLTR